jgi:hypothetical protein
VETQTLALIERLQGADSGPEAVGSLGHQHQGLYFLLGHDACLRTSRESIPEICSCFSPQARIQGVLLRRSPGKTTSSTWEVLDVVPLDATLSCSGTSPCSPGEVRLEAASIEAGDTGAVQVPLAVGLSVPRNLFGALGCASKRPPTVVPAMTSVSPRWDMDTGGVPRDAFSSLHPLPS